MQGPSAQVYLSQIKIEADPAAGQIILELSKKI